MTVSAATTIVLLVPDLTTTTVCHAVPMLPYLLTELALAPLDSTLILRTTCALLVTSVATVAQAHFRTNASTVREPM